MKIEDGKVVGLLADAIRRPRTDSTINLTLHKA